MPGRILRTKETWRRDTERARRRARSHYLTEQEEATVRRAMVFLGVRLGSLNQLSRDLGAARTTVTRAVSCLKRVTPALAMRVARVAGIPLADLLSGTWPRDDECPICGGRMERRASSWRGGPQRRDPARP